MVFRIMHLTELLSNSKVWLTKTFWIAILEWVSFAKQDTEWMNEWMNECELYLRQGGPISYGAVVLRGPVYT